MKKLSIAVFSALAFLSSGDIHCQEKTEKLPPGIIMHLDASKKDSVAIKNDRVSICKDLSGNSNDAMAEGGKGPLYADKAFNGMGLFRFNGTETLQTRSLPLEKGLTAFVLFRREAAQSSGKPWQSICYWGDGKFADNTAKYHLTAGAAADEVSMRIMLISSDVKISDPFILGANGKNSGMLFGDIGEVIVFDRSQLAPEEIDAVRNYLTAKWKFQEDDWKRFGALPKAPERISNDLPFSDQKNTGGWRKFEKMCDEFDGKELDRSKWTDLIFYSYGSGAARFLPSNVAVKDGMLQLSCKVDKNMPSGRFVQRGPEFHTFSTAIVKSMHLVRYGYFEIRSKIIASSVACNFWLIGRGINKKDGSDAAPEIDIYELAGKSFAHTYNYNMALHYVQHKPESKHIAYGAAWKSNFKFTEDFHVYGLEWTPDVIKYYIDGFPVREFKVKKNYWDMPMIMSIDILSQYDWFGVPDEKDFPAVYYVDYVRVWKNNATDLPDDWNEKYKITNLPQNTGAIYDYFKKYGNSLEIPPLPELKVETKSLNAVESSSLASNWNALFNSKMEWKEKIAETDKNGFKLYFPPVAEAKGNGDVQYAVPPANWPVVSISGKNLSTANWNEYNYLALDYFNPGNFQTFSVTVKCGDNKKLKQVVPMKSGHGTAYMQLNNDIKTNAVSEIMFNVRVSDKANEFYITGMRLEK